MHTLPVWQLVAGYNGVVFLVYAADKLFARWGSDRVSERTLLGMALLGGAPGALLGIYLCRHKTRKPRFRVGVPLMLLLQVGVASYLFSKGILRLH